MSSAPGKKTVDAPPRWRPSAVVLPCHGVMGETGSEATGTNPAARELEVHRPPPRLPAPAVRTTRPFVEPEEAVPVPADGGKPGACADHRHCRGWGRRGGPPPGEPQRRRAGAQPALSLA